MTKGRTEVEKRKEFSRESCERRRGEKVFSVVGGCRRQIETRMRSEG